MDTDRTVDPAREPNDLARFFVERGNAGDVEGMVALYEADAVMAVPGGNVAEGREAIRSALTAFLATGPRLGPIEQRLALITGELALTSALLNDGNVTAEVARRQPDGTWLWALDQPDVTG